MCKLSDAERAFCCACAQHPEDPMGPYWQTFEEGRRAGFRNARDAFAAPLDHEEVRSPILALQERLGLLRALLGPMPGEELSVFPVAATVSEMRILRLLRTDPSPAEGRAERLGLLLEIANRMPTIH